MSAFSYLLALFTVALACKGASAQSAFQSVAVYSDSACTTPFDASTVVGLVDTRAGWSNVTVSQAATGQSLAVNSQPIGNCTAAPYAGIQSGEYGCITVTEGATTVQAVYVYEWYSTTTCTPFNSLNTTWVFQGQGVAGSCVPGAVSTRAGASAVYGHFTCGGAVTQSTNATVSSSTGTVPAVHSSSSTGSGNVNATSSSSTGSANTNVTVGSSTGGVNNNATTSSSSAANVVNASSSSSASSSANRSSSTGSIQSSTSSVLSSSSAATVSASSSSTGVNTQPSSSSSADNSVGTDSSSSSSVSVVEESSSSGAENGAVSSSSTPTVDASSSSSSTGVEPGVPDLNGASALGASAALLTLMALMASVSLLL